jgi:hypothetical protein
MDSKIFEDITRLFTRNASRRGTVAGVAGVIGASLTAARNDHDAAARKGKRKRKRRNCLCKTCQQCQRGKCVPAPDGADCRECGICDGGSCVPNVSQPRCPVCTTWQAGVCVNEPTGTPCKINSLCDEGECRLAPSCDGFSRPCTSDETCCSGACCKVLGVQYCCRSEPGDPCLSSNDCVDGANCVAYRCRT